MLMQRSSVMPVKANIEGVGETGMQVSRGLPSGGSARSGEAGKTGFPVRGAIRHRACILGISPTLSVFYAGSIHAE